MTRWTMTLGIASGALGVEFPYIFGHFLWLAYDDDDIPECLGARCSSPARILGSREGSGCLYVLQEHSTLRSMHIPHWGRKKVTLLLACTYAAPNRRPFRGRTVSSSRYPNTMSPTEPSSRRPRETPSVSDGDIDPNSFCPISKIVWSNPSP